MRFYGLFGFRSIYIVCWLNLIDEFSVENGIFFCCLFDREFLSCDTLMNFRTFFYLAIR